MCNCICEYNRKKNQSDKQVKLVVPEWMVDYVEGKKEVFVDACMKNVILHLWKHNIITLGCCCGHNEVNPMIVVDYLDDMKEILLLLREVDDRIFIVCRWNDSKELVHYIEVLKPFKAVGMEWSIYKFIKIDKYEGEE